MIKKYALINVIKNIIREIDEFSIRDVARKVNVSPSTAKEALDFLLSNSILDKRILGRNHMFKVKDSPLTREIKRIYSVYELESSGIVKEILSNNKDVLSIVVYGSVAKGTDNKDSDIDILIISRKQIDISRLKKDKSLSREITFLKYAHNEWKEKAIKEKAFYNNVILNSITLFGEVPVVA